MSSTVQSTSSYLPDEYFSGGISISGLTETGTDFTSMIAQLRKIEMIPTNRMLRWKAEWQARQDAFAQVREALVSLRDICSKMNTMDTFLAKKATSSYSSIATAAAKSAAISNSYKLEVNKVATTSIWSLKNEFHSNTASINTGTSNGTFSYVYGGSTRTLTVPPNTTLEQFKNMINNDANNPGVRASIIKSANGVTFQIKGMDQGKANDLSVVGTNGLFGFPGQSDYNPTGIIYKTNISGSGTTDAKANTSGSAQTFTYSYGDEKRSVEIPANATMQEFADALNNSTPPPPAGLTIGYAADPDRQGQYNLTFAGSDPGKAITISTKGGSFANLGTPANLTSENYVFKTGILDPSSTAAKANMSSAAQNFTYTYNGQSKTISIPAGATLDQFIGAINADLPAGVTVSAEADPNRSGQYNLKFSGSTPGATFSFDSTGGNFANIGTPESIVDDGQSADFWHIQHSQNAQIKVDGWPSGADEWLEVPGNTVDDVVEGVTFTLIGEGTTTVSVNTDSEAVTENVLAFIDAMNAFRSTITALTKYDENKTTVDYNYASSIYDMQKGSILTGNYGIQLISSRLKQATASMPKGFEPRSAMDDLFFGDLYTSLSQIGIKTNANGSGGEAFGMLELNSDPKLPLLEDVLAKNPEAVAEFFAAVNKGVSDSSNFSFSSSMQSITRPGNYEVAYDIVDDGSGNPIIVNATINGKKAKYYEDTNQIGLVRLPPQSSGSAKLPTTATSASGAFADTAGEFYYNYGGQEYSVNVAAGASLDDIAASINANRSSEGVTASVVQEGGTWSLLLEADSSVDFVKKTPDASWSFDLNPGVSADIADAAVVSGSKDIAAASSDGTANFDVKVEVIQESKNSSAKLQTELASSSDEFAASSGKFYYTYDGQQYSVDVTGPGVDAQGNPTQGDSLGMICGKINYSISNPGVKASVAKDDNGNFYLKLESKKNGSEGADFGPVSWDFTEASAANPSASEITAGQDAIYKLYNPSSSAAGTVHTSNTNTITGKIPGVTLTLKGVGTTTITGDKHNDADGLYIQIDNMSISNDRYVGQVRIKQGKINEILELLNGTAQKPEEGILGKSGTLQVLVDNYDKIIEGIDKKIERETERLIKWERTTKLRFSRLEAVLKQYEGLQASIESQVKQLSSNSSK